MPNPKKPMTKQERGRLGGRVGGRARVPKGISRLTPEQRKELSRKAHEARWGKKKDIRIIGNIHENPELLKEDTNG